ncbi:hypothetical protein Bca52824_013669 [Brassica carinata]|uniref:Uncharacterized protein n=1 Tax=Brassica carinata TaxID=52824 RepID=A0A8X7VZS6_BRACI|nr:hypothetical protein Bca52824_013669 [Brassica carinata]
MGLGLILDSTMDDEPDPYTRGYGACWSSHHQMLWSLLGSKGNAHDSVMYSYGHGFSRFCSETYQLPSLSAANPKNLNMVKKLSLALLTQKCGQNLKSLTTMESEGCQNAGKEVVNQECISTPATKSS